MTHQFQSNTTHEAVQLLSEHDFEVMAQAIQVARCGRAHTIK
jgi:hypothetical protein